jgi:hypothetical protein
MVRGAGLSFRRGIPAETMRLEQFVADTLEVTDDLRRHFGRDRIRILAEDVLKNTTGLEDANRAKPSDLDRPAAT